MHSSGRQVYRGQPGEQEGPRTVRDVGCGIFKVPLGSLGKWDQVSNTHAVFSSKSFSKLGLVTPLIDESREV